MNLPMINSTNSVSASKRKREAERSVNWTVEETQVLLCAWSDERIQKSLAENLRNRHVFKQLSARMCELGFARSPHQCRLRVKTLKANYVRAKLQMSVDSSQPCTFKYFAEMDAVLGRRSLDGADGRHVGSKETTRMTPPLGSENLRPSASSGADAGDPQFAFPERNGRPPLRSSEEAAARQDWRLEPEVKMEDRENSTDEYEYSDAGFSRPLRDRDHDFLESGVYHDPSGTPAESNPRAPSPLVLPPAPPPPPAPSPPPRPPPPPADPGPRARGPLSSSSSGRPPHAEAEAGAWAEPALRHLSQCFQRLVSETRGLLEQLEAQRQEQARWHQELLAGWLEREERRQREAADREERREKARMEHEIRVLELLSGLARQRAPAGGEERCRCRGSQGPGAGGEAAGSLHHDTREGR